MIKQNDNEPLISIIVITYNSSKYVLETLESAKAQTYKNIELIVSDDASTDSTVQICLDWLDKNKVRFVKAAMIMSTVNTGISANCNRGLKEANGEWIKYIAGDDVLLENCIEDNIKFVSENLTSKILFSDMKLIDEKSKLIGNRCHDISMTSLPPKKQLKKLLKFQFVHAPSSFIKKSVLNETNGFDEKFPLIEDGPFYIKLTRMNIQLSHFPTTTVCYRIHSSSLWSSQAVSSGFNPSFLRDTINFYEMILLKELLKNFMPLEYISKKINCIILKKQRQYPNNFRIYKYLMLFDILYIKNYLTNKLK